MASEKVPYVLLTQSQDSRTRTPLIMAFLLKSLPLPRVRGCTFLTHCVVMVKLWSKLEFELKTLMKFASEIQLCEFVWGPETCA